MSKGCANLIRAGRNWSLSTKLIMLLPSRKHRPISRSPGPSNSADLDRYLRLLHYFNAGVELPSTISPIGDHNHGSKVPIIGFSATFSRPDQLALSAVFEKIVFHREVTHMLDEGWYVNLPFSFSPVCSRPPQAITSEVDHCPMRFAPRRCRNERCRRLQDLIPSTPRQHTYDQRPYRPNVPPSNWRSPVDTYFLRGP